MLSAEAEALSVAKGKHLAAWRARPFAEFTLSEANGLRVTRFGNFSERLWGLPLPCNHAPTCRTSPCWVGPTIFPPHTTGTPPAHSPSSPPPASPAPAPPPANR